MEFSIAQTWAYVALAALLTVTVVAWRVLNWLWLKPKKLEKFLTQQGLTGTPYRFLVGDLKTNSEMIREATSKPMEFNHNIVSRVSPFLHQSVRNYGKNIFTWTGPIPVVTILNPEQIKVIFTSLNDYQKPRSNPLFKLLVDGILNLEGDQWAQRRKIINPAFHVEKLKNMLPEMEQSCLDMITKWDDLVSAEGSCDIDVWLFLKNLTADVISRTAFGSSYKEGQRIFQLIDQQTELTMQTLSTVYFPGKSPTYINKACERANAFMFLPTKINKKMKQVDSQTRNLLKDIIAKREKSMRAGDNSGRDDLLGILLESSNKEIQHGDNKNVGMSISDVIEECKLFYFAGQETTSVLLVWTLLLLAKHQDWQSCAREEIMRVFGKNKPDFNELNHLKVVTMILHEVLRLYPPVIGLFRAVNKEVKLGSLTLPAGVQISVPFIMLHRDKELWGDDAEEFKPERFSDGVSKATRNQVCYLPFGWGPRICVGQNFAMPEAKMALAMILGQFSVDLSPLYAHAPFQFATLQPQFGAPLILHKL